MAMTSDVPDWVKALPPQVMNTYEDRQTIDGWELRARWWTHEGEPQSEGPRQLVITLSETAPADVRQRGLTSGVLRRIEKAVLASTAEANEVLAVSAYAVMANKYVREWMEKLPAGPREGGDVYYFGLLDLFEDLTEKGHPSPLNLISAVTKVPKETIRSRVKIARMRRAKAQAD